MRAIANGLPRFSGDDGDVPADMLGIGYSDAALELAEAAEELHVVESDELDAVAAPRRRELPALVALGALAGAMLARAGR